MSNNESAAAQPSDSIKVNTVKQKQAVKPLDPTSYVVTVGRKTLSPIRSGMCLLDSLEGPPDFMTRVKFTFSQPLQQLHIELVDDLSSEENKREESDDEAAGLWKQAIMGTGKTYEIALAHSDRCMSRRFLTKYGSKAVYDLGPIRLATNMVL